MINTVKLEFNYNAPEDGRSALGGVDINISEGEFVAVLGHNGSGKSTLAKHFNVILLPSGGKVFVAGMDTADEESLWKIRQTVGMVFQNPDNQLVATVVEEDVAFAPENLGVPPEEIERRVDEALREVGMQEYRLHAPHQLSGGQKQRIAIAGVLAMRPKVLVLDEPTAMLDPSGRAEVLATIKRINREEGITVVLITHFMSEAAEADRVIVMDKGSVLLEGTPHEVFMNVGLLKSVGLDVPQVTELMYELRRFGIRAPLDILRSEECADAIMRLAAGGEEIWS